MLRFVEIALFLAPIGLFVLWRVLSPASGPSPRMLAVSAAVLVALFAALLWFQREGGLPSDSTYVPAHLEDGRIIPGRGVLR
jgi:hypothetical protein